MDENGRTMTVVPLPDGVQRIFRGTKPYTRDQIQCFLNGILQVSSVDYVEKDPASGIIEFVVAPSALDTIIVKIEA